MNLDNTRQYVKGVLSASFTNKSTLDKLSTGTDSKLKFDGKDLGTPVVPNPELSGSEDALSSIQIDTTKYKVTTTFATLEGDVDDNTVLKTKFDEVDSQVASIDAKVDSINLAQRTTNCDLLHGYWKLKAVTPAVGNILDLQAVDNSNSNLSQSSGKISLLKDKTYQIDVTISYMGSSSVANIVYELMDSNGTVIRQFQPLLDSTYEYANSLHCQYHATEDVDVYIKVKTVYTSDTIFSGYSDITVQEIGRSIIVDPVEHIDQDSGVQDSPVGTIISFMGNNPPQHYLTCDGTVYNITEYSYLAEFIKDQFGEYNHFGGDGETTFAVPDLRGEFLRGTGENSHLGQGNGSDVGEHQNGTDHPNIYGSGSGDAIVMSKATAYIPGGTGDSVTSLGTYGSAISASKNTAYANIASTVTSRPTNTSVLYCIKYEPTYFIVNDKYVVQGYEKYSEEEVVVGCWTNGKPVYKKVVNFGTLPNSGSKSIVHGISIDNPISASGFCYNGSGGGFTIPSVTGSGVSTHLDTVNLCVQTTSNRTAYTFIAVIQYTKTTDEPNSFKPDMLAEVVVSGGGETLYTDQEIEDAVDAVLGGNE